MGHCRHRSCRPAARVPTIISSTNGTTCASHSAGTRCALAWTPEQASGPIWRHRKRDGPGLMDSLPSTCATMRCTCCTCTCMGMEISVTAVDLIGSEFSGRLLRELLQCTTVGSTRCLLLLCFSGGGFYNTVGFSGHLRTVQHIFKILTPKYWVRGRRRSCAAVSRNDTSSHPQRRRLECENTRVRRTRITSPSIIYYIICFGAPSLAATPFSALSLLSRRACSRQL